MIHGVFLEAISNPVVLSAVDNELCDFLRLVQIALPLSLPVGVYHRPNENKMSDGGWDRVSLGVEVWKSSQRLIAARSASLLAKGFGVRSIAWLDGIRAIA